MHAWSDSLSGKLRWNSGTINEYGALEPYVGATSVT